MCYGRTRYFVEQYSCGSFACFAHLLRPLRQGNSVQDLVLEVRKAVISPRLRMLLVFHDSNHELEKEATWGDQQWVVSPPLLSLVQSLPRKNIFSRSRSSPVINGGLTTLETTYTKSKVEDDFFRPPFPYTLPPGLLS